MSTAVSKRPKDWRYPQWETAHEDDGEFWLLMQDGRVVGEAYRRDDGIIKWHCKTSDWRDTNAATMEQAKAECECSFWKEAWHIAIDERQPPTS